MTERDLQWQQRAATADLLSFPPVTRLSNIKRCCSTGGGLARQKFLNHIEETAK